MNKLTWILLIIFIIFILIIILNYVKEKNNEDVTIKYENFVLDVKTFRKINKIENRKENFTIFDLIPVSENNEDETDWEKDDCQLTYYKRNYPNLESKFGNDMDKYRKHYNETGKSEEKKCNVDITEWGKNKCNLRMYLRNYYYNEGKKIPDNKEDIIKDYNKKYTDTYQKSEKDKLKKKIKSLRETEQNLIKKIRELEKQNLNINEKKYRDKINELKEKIKKIQIDYLKDDMNEKELLKNKIQYLETEIEKQKIKLKKIKDSNVLIEKAKLKINEIKESIKTESKKEIQFDECVKDLTSWTKDGCNMSNYLRNNVLELDNLRESKADELTDEEIKRGLSKKNMMIDDEEYITHYNREGKSKGLQCKLDESIWKKINVT